MYVTALYYTMTCMTSVGFGNVASETDNEKIFSILMMIVAGIAFFILVFHVEGKEEDTIKRHSMMITMLSAAGKKRHFKTRVFNFASV